MSLDANPCVRHVDAVERMLKELGFDVVARVRVSARLYDVAAIRSDIGVILARCAVQATAKHVAEAEDMLRAGDFTQAMVVCATPAPKRLCSGGCVVVCGIADLPTRLAHTAPGDASID